MSRVAISAATAHHPHPILNFIDGVINPDRLINKDANHRHSTFTGRPRYPKQAALQMRWAES
jgi:hypothetical protein